jgi:pimeloyl-ACP methyl ester carboxylesterase
MWFVDVVLVGHSYGGQVITQAATGNSAVKALVYVSAFAPDRGESALELSGRFDGSTLGDAVVPTPLTGGGTELSIDPQKFAKQFAADVDPALSALMAVTQRPVTEQALQAPLDATEPAWRAIASWFVWGAEDRNIPAALQHFMAERADARGAREIAGASHALSVSRPDEVTAAILDTVEGTA